jgi:hypothetical protein
MYVLSSNGTDQDGASQSGAPEFLSNTTEPVSGMAPKYTCSRNPISHDTIATFKLEGA